MTHEPTCEAARRLMLLADSGEADGREQAELAGHLAACAACRRVQSENRQLAAWARSIPMRPAPALSVPALEEKGRPALLRFRLPVLASIAAALFLTLLGASQWLMPLGGLENKAVPARGALLDEWQFWMVSTIGQQAETEVASAFLPEWNERDFARHLLVLEGLLPEEEVLAEEELPESTPGALPPISLQGYNTPAPLRS
jgi:hypothetical protein